ncbi:MAG: glycosyltransferase family 2 protein [Clostridium sp.]|uniref:glycosyltransferase family 2 protein n=1 Tax=Clostridium sp. TaxID=1506 RepID=UPI0030664D15
MVNEIPKFSSVVFREKANKYCLCIPVINEGSRIIEELMKLKENNIHKVVDIILCDGGSMDGSMEIEGLKALSVNTLLTKTDNGKLSAQLRMGYYWALERGYKGIITVDGNNKDSVESIPLFVEKLDAGYDMIQGSRFIEGGHAINTPMIRHLAVKLIHAPAISIAAKHRFTDTTNGFRGYSKIYLEDNRVKPFRNIFDSYELLAYLSVRATQLGMKVIEVPVTRSYPEDGGVPTKISGIKGNLNLLNILFKTLIGKYNP